MMRRYRETSWLDPRIEIRASGTAGLGSFATAPIAAGERVIEWGGVVLTTAELGTRAVKPDTTIPIGEGVFMCTPAEATDLSDYYLNHSCDPTLWMIDEVTFVARRDIPAGAELTVDYAYWQDEDDVVAPWRCGCGSPLCRGRVTGRDWRLPALQARYAGHFSPFVNARIAGGGRAGGGRSQRFDLVIRGGQAATPGGIVELDIAVRDGRIAALGALGQAEAAEIVEAHGLHVLPGVIDTQVHLREPGLEHKEDLATGTRAAVLGGVTAVFEMPNTRPSTTGAPELADKLARARGRAWCDHAFFVGAAPENLAELAKLERLPGCAGVKLFMGSSTGSLLVADDAGVLAALRSGRRRVAVHAEDEPRLQARRALAQEGSSPHFHPIWRDEQTALIAVERLIALGRRAGRRVHVLHVTSAGEMAFLAGHKDIATVEVTPQHLTLAAPECYDRLGTYAQMNPPIRDATHRAALWRAIADGVVDVIGSDHAPHTIEEKSKPYPDSPSGMPGVQTLVPVLLDHVNAGRLSLGRLVDLTSAGPARIFGIAGKGRIAVGYDADFTIVDLKATRRIENRWIASRCGWTPFDGTTVTGWPRLTVIRGRIVMRDDDVLGAPLGAPVRFLESLEPES